ncbi:helix-turn-helix domain-containing protein [Clostridium pasteurianum]|uniref:Plasmid maintenance system antidote protein n=1 Tax=Clostridium pasteurianum BC1 TaxID=86416 RepID=R4K4X5_CLOPA|nr:helix-turn-helix transcriptional regulator [Clostridium pasteurianum]AGK96766.1 plasmid maintenance system antidote protein [Clostridium pasteurianum BC1]
MKGLTYIRKTFNMSMDDLGKELGVSKQTISNWENGKIQITDDRLLQLEGYFNLNRELFFKDNYTDDEIVEIETRRFQKIMRKYHINKLSDEKFNKEFESYSNELMVKNDVSCLLKELRMMFNELEETDISRVVNMLCDMIYVILDKDDKEIITMIHHTINSLSSAFDTMKNRPPKYEDYGNIDCIMGAVITINEYIRSLLADSFDISYYYKYYENKFKKKNIDGE